MAVSADNPQARAFRQGDGSPEIAADAVLLILEGTRGCGRDAADDGPGDWSGRSRRPESPIEEQFPARLAGAVRMVELCGRLLMAQPPTVG